MSRTVPMHDCPGQAPCAVCDTPAWQVEFAAEHEVVLARKPRIRVVLLGNDQSEIEEAWTALRRNLGWKA